MGPENRGAIASDLPASDPPSRPMRYRWTLAGAALLAALVLAVASCRSDHFEVTLRPVQEGGEVAAIEVHSVIHGSLVPDSGPFSVRAPVAYGGNPGSAYRVRELRASDSKGAIPLTHADDPRAAWGRPYFRHWRADRSVHFPVTITYRSTVEMDERLRPPTFDTPSAIRPSAGGVSGAGSDFLVVPENVTSTTSRVEWDLSSLPPGSAGITSFGAGSFKVHGSPAKLLPGWYMAGPLQRYPASGNANGFSASWLGDLPFDPAREMQWAAEAYTYLGEFFEYLDPRPRYRVFMRMLGSAGRRASALPRSHILSRSNFLVLSHNPSISGLGRAAMRRQIFVQAMIRHWVGNIQRPRGISNWFSEGLTTYYQILLPMTGGFRTVDEYGDAINALARAYYTNPARNWSADRIAEAGSQDRQVRLAYNQRGALYFAHLDSRIRAASNGVEDLHSFVREIVTKRSGGGDLLFDHDRWKDLIAKSLGREAVEEFTDIIVDGKTIIPAPGAFGPCFERQPATFTYETPARRQWRQGITAKQMAVLNPEQRAKLEEVRAAGADSKALEGAVLLGLAQPHREAVDGAVREAIKAIGLHQDQVGKLREIRGERPSEGTQGAAQPAPFTNEMPARRQWRQGITAKLMAVLSPEQRAKLEEVRAAGADSKAFGGAVLLGLVQPHREAVDGAVREAIKAIGLHQDQVAKLREIREERPPEGTQGAEALGGFRWVRIKSIPERTCREDEATRP